jgi:hypothetical protein
MPRAAAFALPLILALAAPAPAGGPIEAPRSRLPGAIAKLHTCVPPNGKAQRLPDPIKVGRAAMFVVGCAPGALGVSTFALRGEAADDGFSRLAFYLAADARGRDARRLVFPYLHPDGRESMFDTLPVLPTAGWSKRSQTGSATGVAFLDPNRTAYPPGAFMLMANFPPADRPHRENAAAIWLVRNGKVSLVHWAETSERLRGEAPYWQYPRYEVVLDRRPES